MNFVFDIVSQWWGAIAAVGGVVLFAIFGVGKVRSDAKKEGVQQERSKQVEAARKETVVAVETKNRAQAAPKSEIQEKFSKYTRKK